MSLTPQSDFPVGCNRIAGCSFPSINGYPGTILHPPPPPERLYKFGTPPRHRRTSLPRAIYHYTVFPPIAGPPPSLHVHIYRSSPAPPPLFVFHRLRGHVELQRNGKKRFLVTCYFIRLGKETHTRGNARVQIDLSRHVS